MAGTKAGGAHARDTNIKKYGEDFYRKIGAKGGKLGRTGGFYNNPELASRAGTIGGIISRRGPGKMEIDYDRLKHLQDAQSGRNRRAIPETEGR